jgi:glycosyltransferase involved in cell wall biosynthesis
MKDEIDFVFVNQGMFGTFIEEPIKPYVIFTDYTASLNYHNPHYPTFFTENPDEAEKWILRERENYRNASYIFTYSDLVRNSMIEDYGVDPDKVITTGIGLTVDLAPQDWIKDYGSKTIISVVHDYLYEQKGVPNVLRAFKLVRERIPDAKLVLVGLKKHRKIDQEGVISMGQIKDRKIVEKLYMDSALFVLTPFLDASPNVLREAMAKKVPCVASDVDSIPEIVNDGVTGRLVPPAKPELLAEIIVELLEDEETLMKMGNNGYERVKEFFSWDKVYREMNSKFGMIPVSSS